MSRIFEQVKEQLSIADVARFYGLDVNRGGFTSCPFHDDKNPSMKLYEKNGEPDDFYCFGCGAGGDVINLVSRLFNLSALDSAHKLTHDFGVAVDCEIKPQRAQKQSIKAKIERYTYELQESRTYKLLADYCDFLKRCRRDYAPVAVGEPLHPLFAKSLAEFSKYEHYRDVFIFGTKDEKVAFMRDFGGVLSGIERELRGSRACQVELA